MNITVLGSGNAFSSNGRGHTCFLIDDNGPQIMLDCGATALSNLQKFSPQSLSKVDAVLLTHFHGDHFSGLPFLILSMTYITQRTETFTVAGPPGTEEVCSRWIELALPGFSPSFSVNYKEIKQYEKFTLFSFEAEALPVTHRPESLGYRMTSASGITAAFTGDTAFDEKMKELITGADLAVTELSFLRKPEDRASHISLEELMTAETLSCKQLLLAHSDDETLREAENWISQTDRNGKVIAAADGMRLHYSHQYRKFLYE